jgi:hypothetical protein
LGSVPRRPSGDRLAEEGDAREEGDRSEAKGEVGLSEDPETEHEKHEQGDEPARPDSFVRSSPPGGKCDGVWGILRVADGLTARDGLPDLATLGGAESCERVFRKEASHQDTAVPKRTQTEMDTANISA